ncbi:hypothetical protein H311_02881, partial [Anncaliia algerae PRA109]
NTLHTIFHTSIMCVMSSYTTEKIILPNSTVYSDCFASYLSYFRNNLKFKHLTVNHSKNFVDPDIGTHTQNIESLWSKFKQFRRSKEYNKRKYLDFMLANLR